jgi:outer membrane lipoprotein SlyB
MQFSPRQTRLASALLAAMMLAACTTVPTGPSVKVMPGSGKSFEQFQADDGVCRQYAYNQNAGAAQASNDKAVQSGVVGTLVGAVAGAAIGGRNGAAVGAGTGLLVGSASGANASQYGSYSAQHRYDISYEQCMYAKGHSVPVARQYQPYPQQPQYAPPPPPQYAPPPPPNTPPPQ